MNNLTEKVLLYHIEKSHFVAVVAAVFKQHTEFARFFGGSDKLPADVNLVVFANIHGEKPYIAELSGGESIKVREWESNFLATNPDSMLSVMKWIIDKYPAYEYATIFGGHGTGSLVYTETPYPPICVVPMRTDGTMTMARLSG